ncbi:MAG: preprotein translocase subunit SecY, partial [Gammaproteobacteria bacterium]|nr:preprotein translocase subunit SecY [Gammaproteobacteria bacterium]
MIQKGWGFGSGISLFILAGVAQSVLWDALSPIFPAPGEITPNYYGAIPALIYNAINGQLTLQNAFVRDPSHLPALLGLLTTVAVFLIVIYFEGIRVELPISHASYRGYRGRYPIKLLYVS